MKRLTIMIGLVLALPAVAQQQPQSHSSENLYTSTFQDTDFGAIGPDGLSVEKEKLGNLIAFQQDLQKPQDASSPDGISIVNKLPTTKTKMYVWVDSRGVTHYADSASKAPKGAKTKVLVTANPPPSPPPQLYTPPSAKKPSGNISNDLPPLPMGDIALPPTSLPPSSLPPIPPGI